MKRAHFWAAIVGLWFVSLPVAAIPNLVLVLALFIAVTWVWTCVICARLRDAGWSPWLVLVFFPLFVLVAFLGESYLSLPVFAFVVVIGSVSSEPEWDVANGPRQ